MGINWFVRSFRIQKITLIYFFSGPGNQKPLYHAWHRGGREGGGEYRLHRRRDVGPHGGGRGRGGVVDGVSSVGFHLRGGLGIRKE